MGLDPRGADPLAPLRDTSTFPPEMEEEYFQRVKTKARTAAREIIAEAMSEAEIIKQEAHKQGYEQGKAAADKELEAHFQKLSGKLSDLLEQIQIEKKALRSKQNRNMALLLKAALEKVLATELETNKAKVLENLLEEALNRIDTQERVTISCSPEDKSFLEDLLTRTEQQFPDLSKWMINPSPTMKKGGLKVESKNGMVDNSIESRYALVREIVEQISLEDEQ
jgi:flagellar assembly protein FliH